MSFWYFFATTVVTAIAVLAMSRIIVSVINLIPRIVVGAANFIRTAKDHFEYLFFGPRIYYDADYKRPKEAVPIKVTFKCDRYGIRHYNAQVGKRRNIPITVHFEKTKSTKKGDFITRWNIYYDDEINEVAGCLAIAVSDTEERSEYPLVEYWVQVIIDKGVDQLLL